MAIKVYTNNDTINDNDNILKTMIINIKIIKFIKKSNNWLVHVFDAI